MSDYFWIGFFVFCGVALGVSGTQMYNSLAVQSPVAELVDSDIVVWDMPSAEYVFNVSGRNGHGFYSYEGYFCIITKDRAPDEIARTTFHELAHYFVDEDTGHFVPEHILERVNNE